MDQCCHGVYDLDELSDDYTMYQESSTLDNHAVTTRFFSLQRTSLIFLFSTFFIFACSPLPQIVEQKYLVKGDGLNQLNEYIGHPKKGDIVKFSMKAHVKSTGKEFEDTHFQMLLVSIEIGSDYDKGVNASPIKWSKGLAMAAEGMLLGDECVLEVKSDYAFGASGQKGSFGTVGPNEDVVLTVALRQINGHRRKFKEMSFCQMLMKCNWGSMM